MKQEDVASLILIVGIASIASFFIAGKFISPSIEKIEAENVSAITTTFSLPESKYFNDQSYNPTVRIEIAPGNNPNPFANSGE